MSFGIKNYGTYVTHEIDRIRSNVNLSRENANLNLSIDLYSHERGHSWQLMMMGIGTYGFTVCIPLPKKLGKWRKEKNYYGAPWETMADILGGVKGRSHSGAEKWNAWGYYAVSTIVFPFTALYWF